MFSYNMVISPSFHTNQKTIDKILQLISNTIEKHQNWTLNIIFLDPDSIKMLNNNYRNIDKVTDVLSFHYYEDFSKLKNSDIAWEIIMCEEKIISQAKEYWLWKEKEFYKLLIHSVLHILKYDHENDDDYKIMSKLENTIWEEVFEK